MGFHKFIPSFLFFFFPDEQVKEGSSSYQERSWFLIIVSVASFTISSSKLNSTCCPTINMSDMFICTWKPIL